MNGVEAFIITVIIGLAGGFAVYKLKVPGGLLVGAMLGVAAFNIFTGMGGMPYGVRLAAQITAGAYIAQMVERDDLLHIKHVVKPAVIIVGWFLIFNLAIGYVFYLISGTGFITSMFCAVPGGLKETPIIAVDMGGDGPTVLAVQFMRMLLGLVLFPNIIAKIKPKDEPEIVIETASEINRVSGKKQIINGSASLLTATGCGLLGSLTGIPSGTLLFTMLGTIILKLLWPGSYLPDWIRRAAQLLGGIYIGSLMTYAHAITLKDIILPTVLLLVAYAVFCFLLGIVLHKSCGMDYREAFLVATPAGAGDIVLIAMDMGVFSQDLTVLQIVRMLASVLIFPQLIFQLSRFL